MVYGSFFSILPSMSYFRQLCLVLTTSTSDAVYSRKLKNYTTTLNGLRAQTMKQRVLLGSAAMVPEAQQAEDKQSSAFSTLT